MSNDPNNGEPTPDVHYYCQKCGTWYHCDELETAYNHKKGYSVVSQKCCGEVIQDAYEWNVQTPWMKWNAARLVAERNRLSCRIDEIDKELSSRWLCDI